MIEDVNHLQLHCSLATILWWDMFSWFRMSWTMPRSVKELLFCCKDGRSGRKCRAWGVVLLALMWIVWRERNRRAFEGGRNRSLVYFWCTRVVLGCVEDLVSFVDNYVVL